MADSTNGDHQDGYAIQDGSDLRKYRTELPNIIYEMGLSPYAGWLYNHLKRTCGASGGKSWKGVRRLSEECKMSPHSVTKARKELEAHDLILVQEPADPRKSSEIYIKNVWPQNFEHFSRVHIVNTTRIKSDTQEGTLEESTTPNGVATAGTFVSYLADELELADVPITPGRKGQYGKDFKLLLERGYDVDTLWKVCNRIVSRWKDSKHYKLTVDQALGDVVGGTVLGTKKPKIVVNSTGDYERAGIIMSPLEVQEARELGWLPE